jgi:hypothetical protein
MTSLRAWPRPGVLSSPIASSGWFGEQHFDRLLSQIEHQPATIRRRQSDVGIEQLDAMDRPVGREIDIFPVTIAPSCSDYPAFPG